MGFLRPALVRFTMMAILLVPLVAAYRGYPGTPRLPIVLLHGLGDQCKNSGMSWFTKEIARLTGSTAICIEIGNGAGDSFLMPMDQQIEEVCRQVVDIPALSRGFNILGLSQGNLIGRGYIEFCHGPPVHNFVSLGGPHAGTASLPGCTTRTVCKLIDEILELGIYSKTVQTRIAPASYVKIPTDLKAYRRGCIFLPHLNNEISGARNATLGRRLATLHKLVLLKFTGDTVVVPPDSEWFGYYADNSFDVVLPMEQTLMYIEDWIGLKELHERNAIVFMEAPGEHLAITRKVINEIVPYLTTTPTEIKAWEHLVALS